MFWLSALVRLYAAEIERWGLYAMVYTYTNFADTALDMDALAAYDLWIADYRSKRPTRKHGMWQHTDKGSVPGMKNGVDLSHAYKDYPGILKRAGLYGGPMLFESARIREFHAHTKQKAST